MIFDPAPFVPINLIDFDFYLLFLCPVVELSWESIDQNYMYCSLSQNLVF